MEVLVWLDAQPWASRFSGEEGCQVFQGFVSFFAVDAGVELLPSSEACIFFSASPARKDPSQLAVKVGVLKQVTEANVSVILKFDKYPPFVLDLRKIQNVNLWEQDQGCSICKFSDLLQKECSCQHLPSFLTLRFQHVAMNIYTDLLTAGGDHPDSNTHSISRLSVLIVDAIKTSKNISESPAATPSFEAGPPDLETLLASSKTQIQQYESDYESVCRSAIMASEICTADPDWMRRLVISIAQSSIEMSNRKHQAGRLKSSLLMLLEQCRDEEQALMSKKGTPANSSMQQLKLAKQKIAEITQALLDLDIIMV